MIREECGLFGVVGIENASFITYLGLHALQHRGHEGAGIASSSPHSSTLYKYTSLGKVTEIFTESILESLKGDMAIGHVRYSTTGSTIIENLQPLVVETSKGPIALAHNGNIVNSSQLREELLNKGETFSTTTDSEVILKLIANHYITSSNLVEAIINTMGKLKGAYSILLLTPNELIAFRDPWGFRPLCIAEVEKNGKKSIMIASEDSAFPSVGVNVKPIPIDRGEIVKITRDGSIEKYKYPIDNFRYSQCVFELIYFAKPSSNVFGISVYEFRYKTGIKLAEESPVEADAIVPIPDSGLISALGFSRKSGIPLEFGLIRSHYIGRTFIEPKQFMRDTSVRKKFYPVREIIEGKRIVIVDDSIVRGTTIKKIVDFVKTFSPKEIHIRIASPPIKFPCFFGIDFSTPDQLIANKKSVEDIRKYLEVDSLAYISLQGLKEVIGELAGRFCFACFSGDYPIDVPFKTGISKHIFETNV